MIEAESEWKVFAASEDATAALAAVDKQSRTASFVQLSPAQTEVLQQHHKENRDNRNASVHQHSSGSSALLEYDTQRVAIDEAHPVVTRLTHLMSQYVGPIGVGTIQDCESCPPRPESEIWVVLDTGSTNIWIASDLCTEGPCTLEGRHRYNHTRSLTFSAPAENTTVKVRFGTGELAGPMAVDNFHIGPFPVPNQTFAMIEEQSGQVFKDVPFEGILGLAFPAMSANNVRPFFDTVIHEKSLQRNEFAFFFQ
jgi:pepsin A